MDLEQLELNFTGNQVIVRLMVLELAIGNQTIECYCYFTFTECNIDSGIKKETLAQCVLMNFAKFLGHLFLQNTPVAGFVAHSLANQNADVFTCCRY